MSTRQIKCEMCGAAIAALLTDMGNANGSLCLECSGATLEDFLEDGISEDEHVQDRVEAMRIFHGH